MCRSAAPNMSFIRIDDGPFKDFLGRSHQDHFNALIENKNTIKRQKLGECLRKEVRETNLGLFAAVRILH